MHDPASSRERRLWTFVALVLAAIASTLFAGGPVAAVLRERAVVDAVVGVGVLLLALAVAGVAQRRRPGLVEVALVVGVGATIAMAVARMSIPAERTHLLEYGLLAVLLREALLERRRRGGSMRRPAVVAAAVASTVGVLDEVVQGLLPTRVFDLRDVGFNVGAAVGAVVVAVVLERVGPRRRPRSDLGEDRRDLG